MKIKSMDSLRFDALCDTAVSSGELGTAVAGNQTTWILLEKCLELIIRGDQHDFVGFLGALAACAHLSVLAGLDYLLCGLLGVLLVSWGEVVNGILHHVSRVYGLLQTAGDALHGGAVLCWKNTRTGTGETVVKPVCNQVKCVTVKLHIHISKHIYIYR